MDSDEAKEMFGNNLSETLELGKEHAKQKAQIDYLKEAQKNLLADLMKDIEGPVSTREMNARTDARYINFCTNFRTARHEFYILELRMAVLDKKFESYRTIAALSRVEMGL